MANLNYSFCLVCCHQFHDKPFQQNVDDNPTLVKWFGKLKKGKFDIKDKPGLSSPPVLCSECLSIMIKVGDKREEVDKVEEQVRCLQKQLLGMLRHLGSLVKDYLEEMKGIEGKIRKEEEEDAGIEDEQGLNNALAFRGHILEEIQELSQSYPYLSSKLIAVEDSEPKSRIEVKMEMEDELGNNMESDDFQDDPAFFPDDSHEVYQSDEGINTKPVHVKEESEVQTGRPKRKAAIKMTQLVQQVKVRTSRKVKREPRQEASSQNASMTKALFSRNSPPVWFVWKVLKRKSARKSRRRKHFACQSCSEKVYKNIHSFEQHLRGHECERNIDDSEKYSCPYCPLTFSLEQLYQFHVCCHEGLIKALCDTCNKPQLVYDLDRHLKEEHQILKPIQCPNCSHFSSTRDNFLEHLRCHSAKNCVVLPCDLCPLSFTKRRELLEHLHKEHQAFEPIPCGIGNCTRTFMDSNLRNMHQVLHTKRFVCLVCDKACGSTLALQKHLKSHEEKQWTCETCGKKLASKEALDRHLKKHENEQLGIKPVAKFQCHLCEKGFLQQSSFKDHLNWHNGRIHKCEQCEATFTHKYSFKRHLGSHANPEKSFVCHECGKTFQHNQHLQRHIKTHFEEKKFECEHCTKRFMLKDQLKQHLRVHSGEKPFVCKICDKAFNQAGSLWHHNRLLHPQSQVDSKCQTTN